MNNQLKELPLPDKTLNRVVDALEKNGFRAMLCRPEIWEKTENDTLKRVIFNESGFDWVNGSNTDFGLTPFKIIEKIENRPPRRKK